MFSHAKVIAHHVQKLSPKCEGSPVLAGVPEYFKEVSFFERVKMASFTTPLAIRV